MLNCNEPRWARAIFLSAIMIKAHRAIFPYTRYVCNNHALVDFTRPSALSSSMSHPTTHLLAVKPPLPLLAVMFSPVMQSRSRSEPVHFCRSRCEGSALAPPSVDKTDRTLIKG